MSVTTRRARPGIGPLPEHRRVSEASIYEVQGTPSGWLAWRVGARLPGRRRRRWSPGPERELGVRQVPLRRLTLVVTWSAMARP